MTTLLLLLLSSCSAEWFLPDDYVLACSQDEDCPGGQTCNLDFSSCVDPNQPICGNGVVELGELCDSGIYNTDVYGAVIDDVTPCRTDCQGEPPYCGDGIVQSGEACDDGNREDDNNGCSLTCQRLGECGDGEVQYYFEACDDGNVETEACDYGVKDCVVCVAPGFEGDGRPESASELGCEYRSRKGSWCGDGVVQQRGIVAGIDTLEWEGCDPGSEEYPVAPVACDSLDPAWGTNTATCLSNCVGYNIQGCDNENMVYVPSGPFMMGCHEFLHNDCEEDEGPFHQVYLDAYLIDRTEVRAGAYKECVDSGACEYTGSTTASLRTFNNGRDSHPINLMTWTAANEYCLAQGKQLPTEAQWEKAARGTDGRTFPWGSAIPSCDWAVCIGFYYDPDDAEANASGFISGNGCGKDRTWEVGSMEAGASPYGVHDIAGNVWEWVSDIYASDYYSQTPADGWSNPEGPNTGERYVLRGGAFNHPTDDLRIADRSNLPADSKYVSFGFRCARRLID
ncbi:MAG: SUMF1/EgtB/PvdO family nonheme iron enzyme [Deltaproteobacteria bacterium]|nr:SUMF1/EgtB/PvdO family nonheme iron enzyme [Deltaproteobacteria bacterium]MBT6435328.1 SUMF1/EgtB/PvdO family nonheme iron enzyme [Deltaproteobacteria bacterium]MBT6490613.1 SUMF1/EgtB/PvdO family nonheme iron enzyme [Deltaproteobacteria bacterium]